MPTHMTTRLLDHCARWWRLPLLAMVLALVACGPGSGGTGTGPVQGMSFSFSGSPNQPVWVVGPATIAKPTCTTDCDRADLKLEPTRVLFSTACLRFAADGAWEADPFGKLVLVGTLESQTTSGVQISTATLELTFSHPRPAESTQVVFALVSDKKTVLLGPTAIQRNEVQGTGTTAPCLPR